jgi:hypothetical protein
MKLLWYPDTCIGGQCLYEITQDNKIIKARRVCSHHAFQGRDVVQENRDKNAAIAAVGTALGVTKNLVPWTLAEDGKVIIFVPKGRLRDIPQLDKAEVREM